MRKYSNPLIDNITYLILTNTKSCDTIVLSIDTEQKTNTNSF